VLNNRTQLSIQRNKSIKPEHEKAITGQLLIGLITYIKQKKAKNDKINEIRSNFTQNTKRKNKHPQSFETI
jgi:hypothetical protein